LVSELVNRSPAVIIAANTPAALAAKAASTVIPIVFSTADDPVTLGLVASIARPGGNVTGVHYFNTQLAAKQLGLLRELLPTAVRFGLLVNSSNTNAKAVKDEVTDAAIPLNVTIDVVEANNDGEIEAAFAVLATKRADALVVAADPLFYGRRVQLAKLATRYALPAIYNNRDYVESTISSSMPTVGRRNACDITAGLPTKYSNEKPCLLLTQSGHGVPVGTC
jgi:putative ABC transport system substrate-binding protein